MCSFPFIYSSLLLPRSNHFSIITFIFLHFSLFCLREFKFQGFLTHFLCQSRIEFDCRLYITLSTLSDVLGSFCFPGAGHLPLSRAESLSGDEYGCQPLSGQGSPAPVRRAASTQTPVLPHRLIRHSSADTSSLLYSGYQHESHTDLSGRSLPSSGAIGGSTGISIAGGLPLSTSQTSMQLTKQAEPSGLSPRAISSRLRDLNLTRKPLHIPYSEFEPYKADMKKRGEITRTGGLDGLLSVHIMSGQGLKSSKTSLRDLYCVVAVDSLNKARTMIRTGAINFDWDEAFDIDLEDAKEASFLIYHWDQNYKHRLCFHGSILLPGFVHSGHKRYVAIKLEPKGILFVTLLYKEPALSLQRLPSLRKNALFGVELETVILRENSGLNVPLIVHKCVLEVERRGLDTVGIYRLCGSARRKVILREVFENSAQAVDLSPENVSDIHVITGKLQVDFPRFFFSFVLLVLTNTSHLLRGRRNSYVSCVVVIVTLCHLQGEG